MRLNRILRHIIVVTAMAVMTITAAQSRDRLFINPMEVTPGEAFQLPIYLSNDTAYCAFQTDLYLPDGMYVTSEDGEYVFDLTARATSVHSVLSYRNFNEEIGQYVYRIMVTSQDNRPLNGSSGAVAIVTIQTFEYFAGGDAKLVSSCCVETNGTKHLMADCTAALTVTGQVIAGDTNGDGKVDIADVNAVINMMLGKATATASANINGDGRIDIADVNAVINKMLGKN